MMLLLMLFAFDITIAADAVPIVVARGSHP